MSDFSEFNNNNYMPGFYGDMNMNSIAAQHNMAASCNLQGQHSTPPQGFTFTSPNHGNVMSSSPRHTSQSNNQIGYSGAPGVGTLWQHSVPTTMPWSNNHTSTSAQYTMSSYDDHFPPFTGLHVTKSTSMEPQPSCSSPMKRPKRKALENSEDAPTSKVYLCTDQFANLQISPQKDMDGRDRQQARTISYGSSNSWREAGTSYCAGWERFREVENSIDFDPDDKSKENRTTRRLVDSNKKGVICFNEKIVQVSSTSSTILPKTILDDITKPCLQVVLWKSPGEILRDVVKENGENLNPSPSPPVPSPDSSSSHIITSKLGQPCSLLSPPPSSSFTDSMMMEDASSSISDVSIGGDSSPKIHTSANSSLLSSSSTPNFNWLHSSSYSSSPNRLRLAPYNQGEHPFSFFSNNSKFDDDMQL